MSGATDLIHEKHIADMRALIESYGAENTLDMLQKALIAESEDEANRYKDFHGKVALSLEIVFKDIKQL